MWLIAKENNTDISLYAIVIKDRMQCIHEKVKTFNTNFAIKYFRENSLRQVVNPVESCGNNYRSSLQGLLCKCDVGQNLRTFL